MSSVINYNPEKDIPRPRTGARGFTTSTGSVYLDPNTPTPVNDELLQELQTDSTFKTLKEAGAITITTTSPLLEQEKSQPQDRVFSLPVPETEQALTTEEKKTASDSPPSEPKKLK